MSKASEEFRATMDEIKKEMEPVVRKHDRKALMEIVMQVCDAKQIKGLGRKWKFQGWTANGEMRFK